MLDLDEILLFAVQVKKTYVKTCRSVCKKYELTQTEFDILDFLGDDTGLDTANEISLHRLIKKANVSTSVDRLIKKGYIRRRTVPEDRRFVHLELTENAETPVSEIKESHKKFFSHIFDRLSREEIETYKELTEKLLMSAKMCGRAIDGGSVC